MLPIQNNVGAINKTSRPGIPLRSVRGIVMHYTGSPGATAKNIADYFARGSDGRFASAHFSVDDHRIFLAIPENEMAYSVGSQSYTQEALNRLGSYPNNDTISIEMCIDKNGNITEATFQNAADLVAYLLRKYHLTVNDIWTHKGVVGWKACPLPWVNNPAEFTRFKQVVAIKLGAPAPTVQVQSGNLVTPVAQPTLRVGSTDYAVKILQDKLNHLGYNLTLDGSFGAGTEGAIKDFQAKNGLTPDGVVGQGTWGKINQLLAAKQNMKVVPAPQPQVKEVVTMAQVLASWAVEAQKFITQHGISDGTRPTDVLTRQEAWVMLMKVYQQLNKGGGQ